MRGPIVSSNRLVVEEQIVYRSSKRFSELDRMVLPGNNTANAMDVYVHCLRSIIGPRQLPSLPQVLPVRVQKMTGDPVP